MDDPINSMKLLEADIGDLFELQTGDPNFQEKIAKIRSTIDQGALKNHPDHFFVMTINVNKGKSVGRGTEDNRRKLIDIIMQNFIADILFVQDLPNKYEDIRSILKSNDNLKSSQTGESAAVIWNTQKFECTEKGFCSTDTGMRQLSRGLQLTLGRLKMVKLTPKQNERALFPFLACSWHGANNSKDVAEFTDLQQFLQKVSEVNNNIPIIVGGDFNINTTEAKLNEGFLVSSYIESERASTNKHHKYIPFKDNFMVYGRTQLSVKWVRVLDLFSDHNEKFNESMERLMIDDKDQMEAVKEDIAVAKPSGQIKDLLDHDPVVGVLKLTELREKCSVAIEKNN